MKVWTDSREVYLEILNAEFSILDAVACMSSLSVVLPVISKLLCGLQKASEMAKIKTISTKAKNNRPNMNSVFKKLNTVQKEYKKLQEQLAASRAKCAKYKAILGKQAYLM